MRCRNAHTAAIDGVQPGAVGDFNPAVVKSLLDAKLLVPVEPLTKVEGRVGFAEDAERFEAEREWARRAAKMREDWASELKVAQTQATQERDTAAARALAAEARVAALEAEVAQLKADLEAATAPKKGKA